MATYTVDLSDVDAAASQLESVAQRLRQSLDELKSQVQVFLSENAGQTIDNYDAVQKKWEDGMRMVENGTAKAVAELRKIGDNYHAGDQQGATLFVA
ncbi:WXG100 family type VII secretion target [Micromonospora sp. WP24]|uniref:WXG100 family type VII secretion target n=1 Tax=Micromonospora sp. WP24 TaxID=2604469 RepID=UPI0011D69E11|nr:WXG100 family type VII secretion target [Micromonospora sp. WP24]TYB97635.1 WXG100 family type VII secretion target [Micromonospora sp. WP24]